MTKYLVAAAIILVFLAAIFCDEETAAALSNPLQGGRNVVIRVTSAYQKIPATGQKCAVTIANIEPYSKAYPVYTGYRGDAGPLTTVGIPVCDGSNTALPACPSTVLVRDAVPDAIWVQGEAGHVPDGGIIVRVEMATGCQVSP